ncbi:hypothetical protein [Brevundimonas sp. NIBR11]|uniref:hypothetical protein n=1 Tax=Brevundimonas sp. NIBR11 TaxID=3015999 RepID=UPI0022F11611|nr:hypothetical protein [Brevundimonas sp. NIBR11]WGM31632.1 hypothetical protein KKHFBJBL_01879 [Brevundimonas sp. NIBR11]
MRPMVVASAVAFVMASLPQTAEAQRRQEPQRVAFCTSDVSWEDCSTRVRADLLTRLDVPSAEKLAEQGYSGIRIFRYDAFGNIWPTVTAISRPAGAHPRQGLVEARTIHADGHVAVLSRAIWESGWRATDDIVTVARDRPPRAPVQPLTPDSGGPPPPPPCVDVPTTVVEVIVDGRVERWSPPSCEADPVFRQTSAIWEMTAAAFPACGHLPLELYGHGLGRLKACLKLDGPDPVAAIPVLEALNIGVEGHLNRPIDAALYDADARLIVGDAPALVGPHAIEAAIRGGALGPRWIRILRGSGDGLRVTVHGLLNTGSPFVTNSTPFTQTWTVSPDGAPRMIEWSVPAVADQVSD